MTRKKYRGKCKFGMRCVFTKDDKFGTRSKKCLRCGVLRYDIKLNPPPNNVNKETEKK